MPTYDYHCQACQKDFTAMHKISEPAPACPDCGGPVKKKLTAPAVRGSGPKPAASGQGCGTAGCGHKH